MPLRQPILVVLGHVDVGKTLLLDKIRGTAVQMREAGGMTQHIGASFLPKSTIEKICEPLRSRFNINIKVPGILVIDTPGHEAFSNLRMRGGSVADMAILVIDALKGIEKQTLESLEILRARNTMFVIAFNKIDRIPGWKPMNTFSFLESISKQEASVREDLENRIYMLMGELSKLGILADRFDRIKNFAKTVAIIPTSAVTGEGIAELLAAVSGMAQAYMSSRLSYTEGPAKGVVLEVKEEVGLGPTLDVIIFDGILRRGDIIVVGSLEKPIISHVRAILMPKPLDEMMSPEDKFKNVDEVVAAAGVKVVAPDIENAIAGAPFIVVDKPENVEKISNDVMNEIRSIRISTDKIGVIIKADALGTLEAFTSYVKSMNIPVRLADVGPVSRRDIIEAFISKELNKYYGCVFAFNVKVLPDAKDEASSKGIPIFYNNIIYRVVEEYQEWVGKLKLEERQKEMSALILPGAIKVLPGYVFRKSDPAIFGVEVLSGRIKSGYPLMKENGQLVGTIQQIQEMGKSLQEAVKGQSIAISVKGDIYIGRNVRENEILYVKVPETHLKIILTKYRSELSQDEIILLEKLAKLYFETKA
ncbi:MAG: translation initiation factor IF-2 [Thermoprotei archaeon]|jgi:translation initiation factor 5B